MFACIAEKNASLAMLRAENETSTPRAEKEAVNAKPKAAVR